MFIEAIVTLLAIIMDILSAYDNYIVKPTKENRQILINHLYELENASDEFLLQMDKAQSQLENGNITSLYEQFAELGSRLDILFFAVRHRGRQIIQDIEIHGFPELDESVKNLNQRSEKVYKLWKKLGEAIKLEKENPKHIRRFFRYVNSEIRGFVIKAKQVAILAVEEIDKKVAHQTLRSTFPHKHIQESNFKEFHKLTSEDASSETKIEEENQNSQQELHKQYLQSGNHDLRRVARDSHNHEDSAGK